jgi:hypothetical protein
VKTARLQHFGAFKVVELSLFVDLAVQFDDQPPVATEKVDEVAVDRDLACEFETLKPTGANDAPEPRLGQGLVAA